MPEIPSDIPSDFKGFIYEPSYEQEVVGLFFSVLPYLDLSLCIEIVRGKFPDCIAWKETEDGYKKFRIEFELVSQHFKEHGHDSEKCDLIVCWEDNWPDCPIEVLELKEVFEDMDKSFILLDKPKFTNTSWTEERFLNRVEEKYPEISDIQKKIFDALKASEELNISMGKGLKKGYYSVHIPSTDYEVRMGIGEDGSVILDYKEFHEEGREKLLESFKEKLNILIDSEKDWAIVFELGKDLKKKDINRLLEILLEEDFTKND